MSCEKIRLLKHWGDEGALKIQFLKRTPGQTIKKPLAGCFVSNMLKLCRICVKKPEARTHFPLPLTN